MSTTLPYYYPLHIIYSYTCWVPTISVLNLAISPCCTNLLLRRWRQTGILQRGVLGYALPLLPFLWCYGVFRCSIPFRMRVDLVFRDIIYVINILYLWHLAICENFLSECVEQLILGIHTMSTCFWHKNRVWHPYHPLRMGSVGTRHYGSHLWPSHLLPKLCHLSHVPS
jgi:hypothetical protein